MTLPVFFIATRKWLSPFALALVGIAFFALVPSLSLSAEELASSGAGSYSRVLEALDYNQPRCVAAFSILLPNQAAFQVWAWDQEVITVADGSAKTRQSFRVNVRCSAAARGAADLPVSGRVSFLPVDVAGEKNVDQDPVEAVTALEAGESLILAGTTALVISEFFEYRIVGASFTIPTASCCADCGGSSVCGGTVRGCGGGACSLFRDSIEEMEKAWLRFTEAEE